MGQISSPKTNKNKMNELLRKHEKMNKHLRVAIKHHKPTKKDKEIGALIKTQTNASLNSLKELSKMVEGMSKNYKKKTDKERAAAASASVADMKLKDTTGCNINLLNEYVKTIFKDIKNDIDNIQERAVILTDILATKKVLFNNLERRRAKFNNNQYQNRNFLVTTRRLTHFYNENIKGQNTQKNVLKLTFITVFSVFLLLFKNEIKDIFRGTLLHKSILVKPELPTIMCIVFMILYLVWLFNNRNIRDVSYYMIATFIGYIIFIQYSSIKLENNPMKPGLFGAAIIPFVLYFIIEKINLDHNIIPIYDKNTKIAYKSNEANSYITATNSLNKIITDYDKLHPS
jgi:hypothetical protein